MSQAPTRVMLVDDNEVDNYLHQRMIEMSGRGEVVAAYTHPGEALRWLADAPRDVELLFLDINMPQLNGFEFLQRYQALPKANQRARIVVMVTSSLNQDDIARAEALGAAFQPKPLTTEAFLKLLNL